MTRAALILLVRLYQRTLSLDHGFLGYLLPNTRVCRFTPTCSEYAIDALETHGAVRGSVLAIRRVGRCQPWGGSGYDPVP